MVSGFFWVNIAQGNYLCNVGPWQTDNFHEINNLYNVVSTMLGPHCIGILFSQCCPNMSGTTLHKKCRFKAQRYTFAGEPVVSNMSDSLFLTGYYITKQSLVFLFNVGSEVYFRIAGQQWTGANIDLNKVMKHYFSQF